MGEIKSCFFNEFQEALYIFNKRTDLIGFTSDMLIDYPRKTFESSGLCSHIVLNRTTIRELSYDCDKSSLNYDHRIQTNFETKRAPRNHNATKSIFTKHF